MSRSRNAAATATRDGLERQRRDLADQAFDLKKRIREDREQLKSVAQMRRELIEQIQQFGIEVVIVAPLENGQGVEETHGRQEAQDEAISEETDHEEADD